MLLFLSTVRLRFVFLSGILAPGILSSAPCCALGLFFQLLPTGRGITGF
jgi:hypothetical protein